MDYRMHTHCRAKVSSMQDNQNHEMTRKLACTQQWSQKGWEPLVYTY